MASRKKRAVSPSRPAAAADAFFPIVGIGASAGGLEAFTEMLGALPADTGMAFVLIQHLDPSHESMLVPLLARKSPIPVSQVRDRMRVEPNHLYVIPPNTRMGIEDGQLTLVQRARAGEKNMPVDYFFQSLAESRKDAAIGVILSGTATDGTFGLKAIKSEGGICFAQDEESAKYPGMPASAIGAGCVDFALTPRKISAELVRIARQQSRRPLGFTADTASLPLFPGNDRHNRNLLLLIRNATGADFTHYKPSTIHRRILRRMLIKKVGTIAEYVEVVRSNRAELDALYEDILIHVTSFFREPETFRTLASRVLPQIVPKALQHNAEPDSLRVWVAGCSTGEEAYSIAIVLAEYFSNRQRNVPVQIFATDLSESSIEHARAGVYAGTTLAAVSAARLARFFVKSNGKYQVTQSLRDMCTFARQDLTRDPPFSRLDLISCRNVMIYMEPTLQKRILAAFHYALKDEGILLVGKSEALTASPDLFAQMEKKGKFYRKRAVKNSPQFSLDAGGGPSERPGRSTKLATPPADLQREADRVVWSRYAHAGVIVDENLQILHFRGDTSPYLAPAAGAASLHLLKMIRSDLVVELRAAFQRSKKENGPVRREQVNLTSGGQARNMTLDVIPLPGSLGAERHFLILFDQTPEAAPAKVTRQAKSDAIQTAKLRQELSATRDYLQAIIEQQETTTEELKAANEEALSNNEELQSTNEELETAKEELQSTNEELVTLTEQQTSRNVELNQLNDDLRNLLDGVQIPILILGNDQCIRRFTPAAERLFNLMQSDIGRPFRDLRPNLDLPDLQPFIARTFDTLAAQEQEVRDSDGRYYAMSVRPYRTSENKIDGVLVVLIDTDAMKRSLEEARRAREYADGIVETMRQPLVVLDFSLRIVTANRAFYDTFQISRAEIEKKGIFEISGGAWNIDDLRDLLERIVPEKSQFNDFKLIHEFPGVGRRILLLNARELRQAPPSAAMILLAMEDVTQRELITEALQQSQQHLTNLTSGLITAQEEERRRISRELHDDLNQRLAMLTVELETLERHPLQSAELIRKQLAALRARTEGISDDVRRTAHRLHPSVVDHLGLSAAFRSLCTDFSKQEKIRVDYREKNVDGSIPPEIALCLYRVAQEALHNVVKHSGARRATVSLTLKNGRIVLTISDTGIGFDRQLAKSKKGLGIVSMEERVRLVVGTLAIRSRPGEGTRVVVEVQLPEEHERP